MFKRRLFLSVLSSCVLSSCLTTPLFAQGETKLPEHDQFQLFLLIGQSNMAGRGKVSEEDLTANPRVLCFTQDQKWEPAVDPLHFDKPSMVGVGIGKTFGTIVAEKNPEIVVGLIPCAVGGSPISSWEPGGYHAQTKSHPYDDMLKRCRVALKAGQLKGILWHQGESDANPTQSRVYEQKLHELIARLRKDLDAPEVPFIAGQLGQFPERPWSADKELVNQAHESLPEKIPHTAFVPANGLTHKGDQVHFNAESYREFGKRYAEVYLKMNKE